MKASSTASQKSTTPSLRRTESSGLEKSVDNKTVNYSDTTHDVGKGILQRMDGTQLARSLDPRERTVDAMRLRADSLPDPSLAHSSRGISMPDTVLEIAESADFVPTVSLTDTLAPTLIPDILSFLTISLGSIGDDPVTIVDPTVILSTDILPTDVPTLTLSISVSSLTPIIETSVVASSRHGHFTVSTPRSTAVPVNRPSTATASSVSSFQVSPLPQSSASSTSGDGSDGSTTDNAKGTGGLSAGPIVGIVFGGIVFTAVVASVLTRLFRRRKGRAALTASVIWEPKLIQDKANLV